MTSKTVTQSFQFLLTSIVLVRWCSINKWCDDWNFAVFRNLYLHVGYVYIIFHQFSYLVQSCRENYCLNILVADQTRFSRSGSPLRDFPSECMRILPVRLIHPITIVKYNNFDATLTGIIHIVLYSTDTYEKFINIHLQQNILLFPFPRHVHTHIHIRILCKYTLFPKTRVFVPL